VRILAVSLIDVFDAESSSAANPSRAEFPAPLPNRHDFAASS